MDCSTLYYISLVFVINAIVCVAFVDYTFYVAVCALGYKTSFRTIF